MKRFSDFFLALLLAIPVGITAKDMTGKWGLGYFSSDAPVGGRFWLNERVGLDVGVGFELTDTYVTNPNSTGPEDAQLKESATSFWLEVGAPIIVMPTERANFFLRPGVIFASLDDRAYGTGELDTKWTQVTLLATPGAEVFFGEHFSLSAGHGIAVDILSVPDEEGIPEFRRGESETNIRSFDASVTYFGFHFYFQ